MKDFFTSPKYRHLLTWVGIVMLILLAFEAGMFVGFHKAKMGLHFDERNEHIFGAHFGSGPFGIPNDDFPEAHGAIGRVLSINFPTIVIEDKIGEKIVRIGSTTSTKRGHDLIANTSITPNDMIVVIGTPNDKAEIEAKFIRLLPPPDSFQSRGVIATTTN